MGIWNAMKEFFTVESPEILRARFERLVAVVDGHVGTWPEVGAALKQIRDEQLYREHARTFDDFCRERWDMSDRHARRLIDAAELHRKTGPTGQQPKTERLARPIAALPEEQQLAAWSEAVELAGDDDVKPEHVAAAVERRKPSKKKATPKPIRLRVPGAIVIIEPGTRGWISAAEALRAALRQIEQREAA